MKHLKYRDDFISNNNQLNEQINSSVLLREYLENDIRFGDSYFGRLVNSSIQMLRTAYKTVRIPFLLKDLENHLLLMVDRIKFDQITKDFPKLYLKGILEEIKVCSLSDLDDKDKLKVLIGWDGVSKTYDPKNPIGDVPGFYKGRKLVNSCLLQNSFDKISESVNRGRLEKALGSSIVKEYLDCLSKYIDELRKLAYDIANPGLGKPTTSPSPSPFNLNLLSLLDKIVNMTVEGISNRFFSYLQFISEEIESEKNLSNLEKLKSLSKDLIEIVKNTSQEELKDSEEFQEFVSTLKNLNDDEKQIIIKNQLQDEIQKIIGEESPKQKSEETMVDEKPVEDAGAQKEPETQTQDSVEKPKANIQNSNQTTTTVPTFSKPTSTLDVKSKVEEPKSQKEKEMDDEEKEKETDFNPKQPLAENTVYSNYIKLILEQTTPPPAPATTTSTITPTPTATTTSTKSTKIKDIWNSFFEEVDKVFPMELTQDDVNKLKSFTVDEVDLAFEITKQPDPLLKIIRIFDTANSIYTTPIIPSGRENGEVWPITYRRFTYVGTGTPGGPKSPGTGPWVHNPLFKQWKRGVLEIMSKPEFKDIFKDIKGLVERFENDLLGFDKVWEQESQGGYTKNLQDFFLDMLKIKNQGDFDEYASKALSKFFGIKASPSKLKGKKKGDVQEIETDKNDIVPNSFVWEPFKSTQLEDSNENQFFAFPIVDQRKDIKGKPFQILFFRPLKVHKNYTEIKFTFDVQKEADLAMSISGDPEKPNWNVYDKLYYAYYGVMKNDFTNGIQITFVDIKDSNRTGFEIDDIYGEPKYKNGNLFKLNKNKISLLSKKDETLYNARLVYFDNDKNKNIIKNKLTSLFVGETSNDNLKNLKVRGSSKKLFDELIEKGKTFFGWS